MLEIFIGFFAFLIVCVGIDWVNEKLRVMFPKR